MRVFLRERERQRQKEEGRGKERDQMGNDDRKRKGEGKRETRWAKTTDALLSSTCINLHVSIYMIFVI